MRKISENIKKPCFQKRGQVSIEYMAVFGITTLIVISLLAVSYYYSNQIENTINTNQIDRIGNEIVEAAESVYYFGEPSKTTMKVYMPEGIKQITVGPNEINFRVKTKSGDADMFYPSSVTLQGNLPASYGYYYITIEAKEGYVWINST